MSTPTSSNTQYQLAQDVTFLARVQIAAITVAIEVQSEATSTADDTKRSQYACAILNNPASYASILAMGVVTQPDPATSALLTASVTDLNLQSVISSIFTAFAGRV